MDAQEEEGRNITYVHKKKWMRLLQSVCFCFIRLVCSDAMARGMDVDNVKYVISYDKPPYIKTYIHRVGRTARAGRAGTAVSLLEKKEVSSGHAAHKQVIYNKLVQALESSWNSGGKLLQNFSIKKVTRVVEITEQNIVCKLAYDLTLHV